MAANAAPGDLDPSFGTGGRVILPNSIATAQGVAVGPDGEIAVVGFVSGENGPAHFMVARLLDDGTPDASFGPNGVQVTAVGNGSGARAVAIQPDGRIIAVGEAAIFLDGDTLTRVAVVRYLADGSLDPTFSDDGLAVVTVPGSGRVSVRDVALQSDGAIVIAASALAGEDRSDGYDGVIARLTSGGLLDGSFGTGGLVTTAFTPWDDFLVGVELDSFGRIVVGGSSSVDHLNDDVAAHFVFTLARYLADGSLDTSFGSGGKVTTDVRPAGSASMRGFVLQDDGTIHAVGHSDQIRTPGPGIAVTRHASNGTLELVADMPLGTDLRIEAIGRDAEGRLLAAGQRFNDGTLASGNVALVRLTDDGTFDTAFGAGGVVQTDVAGFVDWGAAVTTDTSGRIVVAGYTFDGDSQRQMVVFRHAGGTCTDGAVCDDGDPCSAGETCAAGACTGPSAQDGTACDDRNVCTSGETCTAGACGGGSSLECDDCFACDSVYGCLPAPAPVCAEAGEGQSRLSASEDRGGPITWQWRGEGPDASTDMLLCIFQETDPRDPIGWVEVGLRTGDDASCTVDGCWRGGRRGLRYSSRADGMRRISWRNGRAGKDRIKLRAQGGNVWDFGVPYGAPLLVQLTDGAGGCWQSHETLSFFD